MWSIVVSVSTAKIHGPHGTDGAVASLQRDKLSMSLYPGRPNCGTITDENALSNLTVGRPNKRDLVVGIPVSGERCVRDRLQWQLRARARIVTELRLQAPILDC